MSTGIIHLTLEKILKDWLEGLSWTNEISFYYGVDNGSGSDPVVNLPRCVVACVVATETIKGAGIYETQFELTITHSADDTTRAEHAQSGAEILNTITSPSNITLFNQTVDAHIYEIYPHELEEDQESRNWQTIITIPMTAGLGNVGA